METLRRVLDMLRLIPRHPRRIATTALHSRLTSQGYVVSLRTIQRDLTELCRTLPLESDLSKPQGWYWRKDAKALDIPGLDPATAMVFRMVEEHLKRLVPESTRDLLWPWFESARDALKGSGVPLSKWPDKVRVLPKGMPLLPPTIDPQVQSAVYQALLDERWLRVDYRTGGAAESKPRDVNPLAIVQRGSAIYLVGTIGRYRNPAMLLLHRMVSAEILDRPASPIKDFDLDRFIAEGELNYRLGPPMELVVRFSKAAVTAVTETPMAEDQEISLEPDGCYRVRATVPDTHELRAWLRGFGREVEVESPVGLI